MPNDEPKATLLLVDDEPLVRMYGVDALEDAGFEVFEASNADEALLVLDQHDEVQLLFSDVNMPGSMNGLELVHLVHLRWPNIRLLLTSGQSQPSWAALPRIGYFMRKPWAQAALVQKIRDMLAA